MASIRPEDVHRSFLHRSARVKCVDIHPTEPLVLSSLFTGQCLIHNYKTGALVSTVSVTDNNPLRSAKFIPSQRWFVTGADDFHFYVYSYVSLERITAREAHQDFIRAISVHPTEPLLLTASDDMTVKAWQWSIGADGKASFTNVRMYEGHTHFVMDVAFHPTDPNIFASGSQDGTVKVWSVASPIPNFTLYGLDSPVVTVAFELRGGLPYIIGAGDSKTYKVWDLHSKHTVATGEVGRGSSGAVDVVGVTTTTTGHTKNVSSARFHPDAPLIVTGSEDHTCILWDAATFKPVLRLAYGLERVWSLAVSRTSRRIAIGCDGGTVVVKLRVGKRLAALAPNGAVYICGHGTGGEVASVNVRQPAEPPVDGERLVVAVKDRGALDSTTPPVGLVYNSSGQYIAVSYGTEYAIMAALTFKPTKYYGKGSKFAWAHTPSSYAVVLAAERCVQIFKAFKEHVRVPFSVLGTEDVVALHGGSALGVRSGESLAFVDWESGALLQSISPPPRNVYWAASGTAVALALESSVYLMAFDQAVAAAAAAGEVEDGETTAFSVMATHEERVRGGVWVGASFIAHTKSGRLLLLTGSSSEPLGVVDKAARVLGYVPQEGRLYLIEKDTTSFISYAVNVATLEFRAAVLAGDVAGAMERYAARFTTEQARSAAKFLLGEGHKRAALDICPDADERFELAVSVGDLALAVKLAEATTSVSVGSMWSTVADLAMKTGDIETAAAAVGRSEDHAAALLLYSVLGDEGGLRATAERAREAGAYNVALNAAYAVRDYNLCVDLLTADGRPSEALIFARSYAPDRVVSLVANLKTALRAGGTHGQRSSESIADPAEYPNMFVGQLVLPPPQAAESGVVQAADVATAAPVVAADGDADAAMAAAAPEAEPSVPPVEVAVAAPADAVEPAVATDAVADAADDAAANDDIDFDE